MIDDWAWTLFSGFLVGTYANSILYTLEGIAVIQYYSASKHRRDSLLLQAMVYFTFVVDSVSTISSYASVYLVCNWLFVFSTLILMSPFPTVCHHPLGYDSVNFSLWLTRYQCSCSATGDLNYLGQSWSRAISIITLTSGITATIVQCFLISRYWRMSVILIFISSSTR